MSRVHALSHALASANLTPAQRVALVLEKLKFGGYGPKGE